MYSLLYIDVPAVSCLTDTYLLTIIYNQSIYNKQSLTIITVFKLIYYKVISLCSGGVIISCSK